MKTLVLAISLSIIPCIYANAQALNGPFVVKGYPSTVRVIFAQGQTIAGFTTNVEEEYLDRPEKFISDECDAGVVYIDLGKESGKAQFSMVISAKAANQSII